LTLTPIIDTCQKNVTLTPIIDTCQKATLTPIFNAVQLEKVEQFPSPDHQEYSIVVPNGMEGFSRNRLDRDRLPLSVVYWPEIFNKGE